MKEDLIKLRNTMGLIETKNESTKLMAQCLIFIEELIAKNDSLDETKTV